MHSFPIYLQTILFRSQNNAWNTQNIYYFAYFVTYVRDKHILDTKNPKYEIYFEEKT